MELIRRLVKVSLWPKVWGQETVEVLESLITGLEEVLLGSSLSAG